MALSTPGHPPCSAAPPALVTRAEALRGLALALFVLVLGAPAGIVWAAIAPRGEIAEFDGGGIGRIDPYDEAFIGAHLAFLGVTAVAGLLTGVGAWFAGRRWPVAALLAAVLGAFLSAAIALKAGQVFDARLGSLEDGTRSVDDGFPLEFRDEDGDPDTVDPSYSPWLVLAWPAATSIAFAVLALWRIGPPDPTERPSWGMRSASRSRR